MNIAVSIIAAFFFTSLWLAIRARKGKKMDMEQWAVGGRSFGTVFVFILMAGDFYTTFSLLGASGWAYGKGAPAYYILGYLSLQYVLVYFLFPSIWRRGKEKSMFTQADFFASQYKSPRLGLLTAILGVIAMLPYLTVQLKGLGIIVSYTSGGLISPSMAIWIAGVSLVVYILVSGIHGSAWTAIVKDAMILVVAVGLGIYLPIHYYGGIGPMFEAVDAAMPNFLKLPDEGLSPAWFVSTIIMNVLGGFMWPHVYGPIFSAKNGNSFKKNAIIAPLYTLMLLFVLFVGFTAILQTPGLTGGGVDLALLALSVQTFNPWLVGLIGAAGLLTALVPCTLYIMSTATLLANNVYKYARPQATPVQIKNCASIMVPVLVAITMYNTFQGGDTLVALLLMGFSLISQLAPALFASFLKRNPLSIAGAASGMIVGVAIVAWVSLSGTTFGTLFPNLPAVIKDINIGILAMFFNVAVALVVSLFTRSPTLTHTPEEAL